MEYTIMDVLNYFNSMTNHCTKKNDSKRRQCRHVDRKYSLGGSIFSGCIILNFDIICT